MSTYEDYIERYKKLHTGEDPYIQGGELKTNGIDMELFAGIQFVKHLMKPFEEYVNKLQTSVTLLDYGCGRGHIPWRRTGKYKNGVWGHFKDKIQAIWLFDPAYPPFSKKPPVGITFDVVSCADVLEHIPEEHVDMVLKDIDSYTDQNGLMLFSVSGNHAGKSFYNGENLHITVKNKEWWTDKIKSISNKQFILVHKEGDSSTITKRIHRSGS